MINAKDLLKIADKTTERLWKISIKNQDLENFLAEELRFIEKRLCHNAENFGETEFKFSIRKDVIQSYNISVKLFFDLLEIKLNEYEYTCFYKPADLLEKEYIFTVRA